jgi:hypothetical protein
VKDFLAQVVLAAMLCASTFGYGYHRGHAADQAAHAKAEREAHKRFVDEIDKGREASRAYASDFTRLTTTFRTLQGQFHELSTRVPLVARRPGGAAPGRRVAAVASEQAQPAAPDIATGAEAPQNLDSVAPDPGLSAAAVWMWNSALAARDVPAGACGAADTSEAACAVDTGLPLTAAWDNHAANAEACAANALGQQRLIDYLNAREKRQAHVRP